MKTRMPGRLTMIGGALIIASGVVSLVIALTFGAVLYEVDPNGLFGHVGIVAGLCKSQGIFPPCWKVDFPFSWKTGIPFF